MPKLRKGSPEAKAYMAKLRAMRGKGTCRKTRKIKGGSLLASVLAKMALGAASKIGKRIYHKIKGNGFSAKSMQSLVEPFRKIDRRIKDIKNARNKGGQRIHIPSIYEMSDEAFDKMMEERRKHLMQYDPGAFHRSGGTYRQLIYPRLERQRRKREQAETNGGVNFL